MKKPDETSGGEKRESAPVTYGGYTARKEYEDSREKNRASKWAAGVLIAVLSVLSIIGVIALARGDFFGKTETEPASSLKVPSVNESGADLTPEDLIAKTRESTFVLALTLSDGTVLKRTGFVMTSDGYAVTDAAPFLTRSVTSLSAYPDGNGSISAHFVNADEATGIALIRLDGEYECTPVSFAPLSFSAQAGCEVYSVGDQEEGVFYGCALSGRVASVIPNPYRYSEDPAERSFPVYYTDFPFNETCWGAPLINTDGKTIGFCSSQAAPFRTAGTVIPADTLIKTMNLLAELQNG